jgi:hypothetical protein
MDVGRLDLARPSLGNDGRQWRNQIQELEGLGRGPDRWATANSFNYFDSYQS